MHDLLKELYILMLNPPPKLQVVDCVWKPKLGCIEIIIQHLSRRQADSDKVYKILNYQLFANGAMARGEAWRTMGIDEYLEDLRGLGN